MTELAEKFLLFFASYTAVIVTGIVFWLVLTHGGV